MTKGDVPKYLLVTNCAIWSSHQSETRNIRLGSYLSCA